VGRQVPPLPRLLVDQGRRRRRRRACQLRCCCCGIDIALPLSSVFFGFFFSGSRCLYCIVSSMYRRPSLRRALRCTSIPPRVPVSMQMIPGHVNEQSWFRSGYCVCLWFWFSISVAKTMPPFCSVLIAHDKFICKIDVEYHGMMILRLNNQ
jgi:hypothetical protein